MLTYLTVHIPHPMDTWPDCAIKPPDAAALPASALCIMILLIFNVSWTQDGGTVLYGEGLRMYSVLYLYTVCIEYMYGNTGIHTVHRDGSFGSGLPMV